MVISVPSLSKRSMSFILYQILLKCFSKANNYLFFFSPRTQCVRIYSFVMWVTEDIRRITDLFKATHKVGFSNRHRIQVFRFHFSAAHSGSRLKGSFPQDPGSDSPVRLDTVSLFFSRKEMLSNLKFLMQLDSNQNWFACSLICFSDDCSLPPDLLADSSTVQSE